MLRVVESDTPSLCETLESSLDSSLFVAGDIPLQCYATAVRESHTAYIGITYASLSCDSSLSPDTHLCFV